MKKNGFTLIELLAVIVILSIITVAGLASFSFTKNTNPNKEKPETNIERSMNVYYQNLYKNNKLKYSKNNDTMEFCVSLTNLVKGGYLNDNNLPKDENGNVYKYALIKKVSSDTTQDLDYTYTSDENLCKKSKINISSVKNENDLSEGQVGENEELNKYRFHQSITQIDTDSYKVSSDFSLKVLYEIDTTTFVPIYTVMVLDRSGSMSGTPIINAAAAIRTLTTNFNAINNKYTSTDENRPVYCTSVVEFQDSASLETAFTDGVISPGTSAPGGTVYGAGLSVAESVLNNKLANSSSALCKKYATDPNALGFVIFLSDGYPADTFGSGGYSGYSDPKVYSERMKQNNVTIFTISYGLSNNDNLKCIASRAYGENEEQGANDYITCSSLSYSSYLVGYDYTPSGSQKKVFYFESSTSQSSLNTVFEKFSKVATKMSQSSEYETAKITFTLNDTYFEKKKIKQGESPYVITSTVDLTNEETRKDGFVTGATNFDIRLKNTNINDNIEIPLFKAITIELIDNDQKVSNKIISIPDTNIPKVNAYKYVDNLVN